MKNMLASIIRNKIVTCIVLLVLGVLMLLMPGRIITTVIRLVGAVLLAGAVVGLLVYFLSKKAERSPLVLIESVIAALVGIFFLIAANSIAGIFPRIVGVLLLLNALLDLVTALRFPRGKAVAVLLSLLAVVASVVILCNPNALANAIVRLIGFTLVYSAVVGFLGLILGSKRGGEKE